jgi:ferrous iron transport protein A
MIGTGPVVIRVMTLDALPLLEPATIDQVEDAGPLTTRMRAMGLRAGREVMVVRRSRLGGPMQVRVGSTDLIIRPREARLVRVREPAG